MVVFPAVALGGAHDVVWAALVVGAAVQANAIASNLRDVEAALSSAPALRLAQGVAALGVIAALLAPPSERALGFVPLASGLTLLRFEADEGYGLVVVDGALLVGALAALAFYLA